MPDSSRATLTSVLYPILLAGMAGAAWLDGLYARTLRDTFGAESLHDVFSAVSDRMLLPFGLTMLAGVLAGLFASGRARWLYAGSLGALLLELLLPSLVGAIPGAAEWTVGKGLLLRLVVLLSALVCAVFALRISEK